RKRKVHAGGRRPTEKVTERIEETASLHRKAERVESGQPPTEERQPRRQKRLLLFTEKQMRGKCTLAEESRLENDCCGKGRATTVVMVGAWEAEEAEREGCYCCWRGLRLRSLLVEKSGWHQRLGRRVEQRQGTYSCYDREGGRELLSIAIYCLS
ncbi:hypothetical protein B296_00059168, partial [Ensete ventricosum]